MRFHRSGPVWITQPREATVRELPYPPAGFARLPHGPSDLSPEEVASNQRTRLCLSMGEALRHAGGLRDVDTQMLVDLSGVSRRAFYELFGDKIDCFIWAHTLAVNRIGVHKRDEQEMAA